MKINLAFFELMVKTNKILKISAKCIKCDTFMTIKERELLRCSQKTDFFEKVNFDFNVLFIFKLLITD